MAKFFAIIVSSLILSSILCACHGAEKSAAMVLDSAGSVVRSGDEKVWIDPHATPTPSPDKY